MTRRCSRAPKIHVGYAITSSAESRLSCGMILVSFARILRDGVQVDIDVDGDRAGQFECAADSRVQADFELGLKRDTAVEDVSQVPVEVVRSATRRRVPAVG